MSFLNDALNFIALNKKLAALEASDTVSCTTDSSSVALPDDYMHGLYHVSDGAKRIGDPAHYHDFARFLRRNPDLANEGGVKEVCVNGDSLYYANREAIDLTVRYFKTPTELAKRGDTPSCIPAHLHRRLLVNYVCWQIFDEIEDGIDDPKTNTQLYQQRFFGFLREIDPYCINTKEPTYIDDSADRIFG